MEISVVIVNYKTSKLINACIESILHHTCSAVEYEIIVVDNNSCDDIEKIVNSYCQVAKVIMLPANIGFGAANNVATKEAKGKYILFLNPDTLFVQNSLQQFYDYMEDNNKCEVCGGILYHEDDTIQGAYGNFPTYKELIFSITGLYKIFKRYYAKYLSIHSQFDIKQIREVDYILGADIFIRKDVFNQFRGFDDSFFLYYEETDLFYRLKQRGIKPVILPFIKIIHLESKSFNNSINKMRFFYESQFRYFRKHKKNVLLESIIKCLYITVFFIRYCLSGNNYYMQMSKIIKGI